MNTDADRRPDMGHGFGIGDWWIEPLAGILERGGQRLRIEPKVMDVLTCLARHPGEIVTRDSLMSAVWGGVVVTDDVLTRCISELRTVLGDTDRERRFIRTIPKRGYSLIAPVHGRRPEQNGSAAAGEGPASAAEPPPTGPSHGAPPGAGADATGGAASALRRRPQVAGILFLALAALFIYIVAFDAEEQVMTFVDSGNRGSGPAAESALAGASEPATASRPGVATGGLPESLAVLPFVNLGGGAEHDFFSDGLSEDLRNGMLTSTELRVSARTSSRAFKDMAIDVREIGRQLEVDALLEGTVRISGDLVRVTTQLTDVADGYPLWAGSYERELGEPIATQVELAEAIIRDLAAATTDGRDILMRTPTNIAAHEYYLLGRHHWHLRNAASLEQAITYFEDALELEPGFALAYSGLSDAHLFRVAYARAPEDEAVGIATRYAQRAVELGPELAESHASMGLLYEYLNEPGKARNAYTRAVEIKPQYSMARMWLGNTLTELGDIREAFRHLSIARDLDPLHPQVQFNFVNSLMQQGRYDEAKASLDNFLRYRRNEMLTQQKLAVDFYTGRYDLMLQNAVGYTHGGSFTPYNSRIVIESLIYLQRFDEAESMIRDNIAGMDESLSHMLSAELAVARRDAESLHAIATAMAELKPAGHMKIEPDCLGPWAATFDGIASYIADDHAAAVRQFERLIRPGTGIRCIEKAPEGSPTLLAFLAASRLELDPADAEAERLLAQAADEILALRANGFDTPRLGIADAAVRWYRGDAAGAETILEDMSERGWRVFGLLRFSPLYDAILTAGSDGVLAALSGTFGPVEQGCEAIGLAKLGL